LWGGFVKKLLLIDGNNLLFRSYYATAAMGNLMQNSQGIYTNGIYGFINAIQSIIKMDFTHILVALDTKEKTIRHELFEEYKGKRKETPSELIMQFPYMKEYLDVQGISRYEKDRYEADDIIGYLVKHQKAFFDEIVIMSNDHDLLQLIDENVSQMISKRGLSETEVYTPRYMIEKLGIHPYQMTDYKGLVGDPSDNIPGIPGIGDKTAVKLLQEYETLENVIEHSEELKGKLKEKVVTYQEQALFSKKLATIEQDFDNELEIDTFEYTGFDQDKLISFFQKMEFHSFLKRMNLTVPKKHSPYKVIYNASEIQSILTSPMSIHLELMGSNYHSADKIGFGLQSAKGLYYIPYVLLKESVPFQNWLKDPKQKKHTFDLKQLKVVLLWDGFDIEGVEFDLLLAAYLINPNFTKEDFKVIVTGFDYQDIQYDEEIYGKGSKFCIPDSEVVIPHILNKVKAIFSLRKEIIEKIEQFGQLNLLKQIEMPLANTLAIMEHRGILIDQEKLSEFGENLHSRIQDLEKNIYELSDEEFNINSPKQLGVVLFEKLELPYQKKNKTGYSTDISVLKQLMDFHPIIAYLIEYRSLTKLYSTYYEGFKTALTLKNDSRIHTIYKQALTQTGRLSSIEPNLQNIPIKTEDGKELRKVFVSEEGCLLYSCDYSQIELRVLAEMADVTKLKEAFRNQEDIHSSTAKLILKKEEVSSLERRQAKAINFGIIYGKTAWGLSEDLQISPKHAERFIQNYFDNYPEIKGFMDKQIEDAKTKGYVLTMFQRRRYIPEVNSSNYQMREFGKRMAMNAPIQGSAADILKIAMVSIQGALEEKKLKTKLLLQIHDELVFSVPESEKDQIELLIKDKMEHAVTFSFPLVIDSSFGTNLFEVK